MHKDKLIVDLSDVPNLAEAFSRKQPGESCKFTGTATLDEVADGVAVLSVEEIKFGGSKRAKAEAEAEPKVDEPAAKKSAAVKLYAEEDESAPPAAE